MARVLYAVFALDGMIHISQQLIPNTGVRFAVVFMAWAVTVWASQQFKEPKTDATTLGLSGT